MNQTIALNSREYIVFDDSCICNVESDLFRSKQGAEDLSKSSVERSSAAKINKLGRGSVYMFQHQGLDLVLRHYRRGGMVRHFIHDSYIFTSLNKTRMWQEFYLLQAMKSFDLPVPTAIAARCVKNSPFTYCGDLITQMVLNSQTVAELLQVAPMTDELWAVLGRVIARFHSHNVYHADLNANNILVTESGNFYLIDFDRGELRNTSNRGWTQGNLNRLLRSFHSLSKKYSHFHFTERQWQILLKAYQG